jgi:Ca2+-binding EF-hand superfamily protein
MKNPTRSLHFMLGIALLISASVVSAGPHHEGGQNKFLRFFDSNGDGNVTQEEFQSASSNRFERIDADNNASISESEFLSYMQTRRDQRHKERFARLDANKDGKISNDEFISASRERAQRRFERMDRNNDGQLSSDELGSRKKHKKHGKRKSHFGKKIFSRIDANGDGQVTKEESQAAWGSWFKRMDMNSDQVVTMDEIKQARDKWQSHRND